MVCVLVYETKNVFEEDIVLSNLLSKDKLVELSPLDPYFFRFRNDVLINDGTKLKMEKHYFNAPISKIIEDYSILLSRIKKFESYPSSNYNQLLHEKAWLNGIENIFKKIGVSYQEL